MEPDGRHSELQRLAREQWGVLKVAQILGAGFSRGQIKRLHAAGIIYHRFKGIWSYGSDWLPVKGVLLAAQWSCGSDAYLTARTALGLVNVCGLFLRRIQVAVPRKTVRKREPPIYLRRASHPPKELREEGPLRFAPVEHAILDLSAQGASVGEQKRLISAAVHRSQLNHAAMRQLIKQSAGQRGIDALTEAYAGYVPAPGAKHKLELSFDKRLLTRPWIPEPVRNEYMVVAGIRWELDRYWPEYKLLVELHGGAYHDGEDDLDKDTFKAVKLALVGIQLLPITGNRWDLEPEACLDDVEEGLALRGWLGRRAA